MCHAKRELLETIEWINKSSDKPVTIKCCAIKMEYYNSDDTSNPILLREGYTQEEYEEFLNKLDFDYDDGFGLQHMFGTVWLSEPNIWMDRGEYDGSEWWRVNQCPEIPEELSKQLS